MLNSYIAASGETTSVGVERMTKIFSASTANLNLERSSASVESKLLRADIIMATLDLDGVALHRYDDRGRPIDDDRQWTDRMTSKELKLLGQAFLRFQKICEGQGKKFILALNTNREYELAVSIFAQMPTEIQSNCLASLEAGHVLMHIDTPGLQNESKLTVTSLPDTDTKIANLKKSIGQDLDQTFKDGYFGKLSYKPNRNGMITYRNVDKDFVGWDEETKTISGPLLAILEKHGYPHNSNFKVVFYPFDGGLDIQFTKFDKKSGEAALIDEAVALGLIQKGQEVVQFQFGDTQSDAINGSGMTKDHVLYDVFTIAVGNSQERFASSATLGTQSNARWGVFEGVTLLENMLTQPKQEAKKRTDSIITLTKLLRSYLGPETPQDTDFNLREAIEKINLDKAKTLIDRIKATNKNNGRVFVIGNGGSYDNARLISLLLRAQGINADVPGSGQKYLEAGLSAGHDFIFEQTLKDQKLGENDLLITISGSGNSTNIIKAIEYAQTVKAGIFALGGRDGGVMTRLAQTENAFVAKSNTMEIIEDVHAVFGYLVATSLNASESEAIKSLQQQQKRSIQVIEQLLETENSHALARILLAVEKTLITKGRIIIIGDSLSANHVRADMARGATNQLPFSFRVVENIGSTNSMLATQNDDGPDFTLVHALENIRPKIGDIVIILNSPGRSQDYPLNLCHDLALDSKANVFLIGDNLPTVKSNVKFTGSQSDYELMTTVLADLFGRTLHEDLITSMNIKISEFDQNILPLEINEWLKTHSRHNRKLSQRETLQFENKLRHENILPENKVIAFCYGKIFIVDSPDKWGLERAFY